MRQRNLKMIKKIKVKNLFYLQKNLKEWNLMAQNSLQNLLLTYLKQQLKQLLNNQQKLNLNNQASKRKEQNLKHF